MAPSVPDKISCTSAKDLRYALDPLRPLAEQLETEENWDKISRAIQTMCALARGGATEFDAEYVKEIRNFSAVILNSMNSERTRLSNVAVDLFTVIAPPLGNKFEPLIPVFLPTLIRLLARTNKVFVSRATAALQAIISNCPHPRIIVELRIMVTDKSASLRVITAGAVLQCLSEWDWSVPSFAAKVGEIENVVRAVGTDSNVDARKIARQIFELYKQMFPDRLDEFLAPLTPVIKRYLDIKAKATRADTGTAPRKQAPVPAPRFPERRAAPASAPPVQEVFDLPPTEPARPKMTRVGASRSGPSRAPVTDSAPAPPFVAPVHSRVVSGPERMPTQSARALVAPEATRVGPMRVAVPSLGLGAPSLGLGAPPVARSVSASGPARVRVDPASSAPPPTADALASSYPQPATGPSRRFRPARAPMDPSQMPQRVPVPPPVQKPSTDTKKPDGPSRVNLGGSTRAVSTTVSVAPPTRVVSTTVKPERELKASSTAPTPPASTNEPSARVATVPTPVETPAPVLIDSKPTPATVSIPSPMTVPIPASAPVSRPASVAPSDSRPPSVASTATSMAPSVATSASVKPTSAPAPAPTKPALVSSKSAPISAKVSALIKRGNPHAPPPFVPKRTGAAAGGAGAATASQMARQREAIAAREKRETEDAAKKAKIQKKDAKVKDAKETQRKEKDDKPVDTAGPSKPTRSKPVAAPPTKASTRNVPAAPRKVAVLDKTKPQGGPPRVNVKGLEPEMVAAVCVPLPGSPTPLAVREVPLPLSPAGGSVANGENTDVEEIALDVVEEAAPPVQASVVAVVQAEPIAGDVPMIEEQAEQGVDMEETEDTANEADQTVMGVTNEEPVQTPQRTMPISLIDQTPAPSGSTPAAAASSGFAFHPQLAQLMALPPQATEEFDDFLVDLSSPPTKERPVEKDGADRYALGERGNTNAYLSQFTQDLMMLSGL